MIPRTYTVLAFFCGLGGKTLGFQSAETRLFGATQRFRSLGGIDVDAEACEDFRTLTGSPALCADVATLTPMQLRAFAGDESPDVVIGSPPCKGFSSLLADKKSKSAKYQALNALVFAWLELVLATWETPPRLILLENVPRIQTRGAALLEKARSLLHAHGYVSRGSNHDCGELGGLAQHRRRFLLVARHTKRVPSLLYEPPKKRVLGCGEVLGTLPLPGDPSAGPLHKLPAISWLNWVRLALIPPGGDWRDLPSPEQLEAMRGQAHHNKYVVLDWGDTARTIMGATRPGSGAPSVADARVTAFGGAWGVIPWGKSSTTVTGNAGTPGCGAFSVADPRVLRTPHPHTYGILAWDAPSHVVKAMTVSPGTGPVSVADPRMGPSAGTTWYKGKHGVLSWSDPSRTVIGGPSNGADAIADPRLTCAPFTTSRAYGVLPWTSPAYAVTGAAQHDNGAWSVSDPRVPGNPALAIRWEVTDPRQAPPYIPVLPTVDGTWHRPLTTLELAALQGLPTTVNGNPLVLAGPSTARHRERIGNAVPPPTARAIAEQMLATLVASDQVGFALSGTHAVWVRERAEARS